MFNTSIPAPNAPPAERLLVLGLDGATFDVLCPLAAEGVMPCLARLLESAACRSLRSTSPAITPAAWSTFQTGCDPAEHGIWDFRYLDHLAGVLRMNSAARLVRPTLLDAVSAAGGAVVSLGMPMTYGPRQAPRGIVVGGFDSPSADAALAPHAALQARLRRQGISLSLDAPWKRCPRDWNELARGVAATQTSFDQQRRAAEIADGMTDWRLMFVQFQALDALQHRCWHLLGLPSAAPDAAERPGGSSPRSPDIAAIWVAEVRAAMRALDDAIARLAELADRRGAALCLVSDHGFGAYRGTIDVGEILRRAGLSAPREGAAAWRRRAARWQWKAARWWQRRQRPEASLARFPQPLSAVLPCDTRRSIASALHGDLAAMIYVHTRRRFGQGQVSTPRLYEQALADTIAVLAGTRHPQTDEPLFQDVYSVGQRHDVDPVAMQWPDVIAVAADGFHTRHKPSRRRVLISHDAEMMATHRPEGVWMLDGIGNSGSQANAQLRDVAPTLLAWLGIEPVQPMSGAVHDLGRQHDSTVRGRTRVARFDATHAAPPSEHMAAIRPAAVADDRLVEARLRSLGYLR